MKPHRKNWRQISLRIKPELYEGIELAVIKSGLTRQDVIRAAIEYGLCRIEDKPAI